MQMWFVTIFAAHLEMKLTVCLTKHFFQFWIMAYCQRVVTDLWFNLNKCLSFNYIMPISPNLTDPSELDSLQAIVVSKTLLNKL